MPRGPVAEFPFYDRRIDFHIHTRYMLNSTAHWQPLVNGYSDHIPADFRTLAPDSGDIPVTRELRRDEGARGCATSRSIVDVRDTAAATWPDIERRLQPYLPHLRRGRRRWGRGDLRGDELAEVRTDRAISFSVSYAAR